MARSRNYQPGDIITLKGFNDFVLLIRSHNDNFENLFVVEWECLTRSGNIERWPEDWFTASLDTFESPDRSGI